jgi:hypothetical protein
MPFKILHQSASNGSDVDDKCAYRCKNRTGNARLLSELAVEFEHIKTKKQKTYQFTLNLLA